MYAEELEADRKKTAVRSAAIRLPGLHGAFVSATQDPRYLARQLLKRESCDGVHDGGIGPDR